MPNDLRNGETPQMGEAGTELREISREFLRYLSSAPNQIPPERDGDWSEHFDDLFDMLNIFSMLGSYKEPELVTKGDVKDYCQAIDRNVEWLEDTVEAAIQSALQEERQAGNV